MNIEMNIEFILLLESSICCQEQKSSFDCISEIYLWENLICKSLINHTTVAQPLPDLEVKGEEHSGGGQVGVHGLRKGICRVRPGPGAMQCFSVMTWVWG